MLDAIAKTLRDHPKVNPIVYRGLTGYRWVQFETVDIAVAVEARDGDVDIAYATIIRNTDDPGVNALTEILRRFLHSAF